MSYTVGDIDRMRETVAQLINWQQHGHSGFGASSGRDLERALLVERWMGTYIAAGTTPDELDAHLVEVRTRIERQAAARRRRAEDEAHQRFLREQRSKPRVVHLAPDGQPSTASETPWWLRLYRR